MQNFHSGAEIYKKISTNFFFCGENEGGEGGGVHLFENLK